MIEGGTLQRVLGNYTGFMEYRKNVRTERATAILQSVTKINGFWYLVKLFAMHILPVIHTGYIVYQMCAFVGIQFQVNMIAPTQYLLSCIFEPNDTRNDTLYNVFPPNTMYMTQVYYPNGTSMTIDANPVNRACPDRGVR